MILSTLENGKIVKAPCSTVDFDYSCDVLCVGAGGAGVYAADSAAREGADVILCEIGENIGGMHVCGNVTGYYFGARGGSYADDDKKSKSDKVFLTNGQHWEQRQLRLTERLDASGVRLLCRHSALGLYFEDNRVVGILAFDGERKVSIKASITIDATSDGHLIRMTDVKKHYGRPSDNSFVPFGVFLKFTENGALISKNNDSGIMDHYSSADFSDKTVMAHANVEKYFNCGEIVNLALHTGVREGLTFEGEELLSYENILLSKRPERTLFIAYSDLDRHGSLRATEEELFQSWWVISNLATVTLNIPVPMGCVVPKGIGGLVTAGRCLCCDTYSQSAVRMNTDMFRMGECVGIATAMASKCGCGILDIDYEDYLSRVNLRGCFDGHRSADFGFDNTYRAYLNKMHSLGRTPDKKYEGMAHSQSIYEPICFDVEKNLALLKTDAPGVALWSCFISDDKAKLADYLYRETSLASDELYKYNCAIALGFIGDKRALPTLREIVEKRDCFFFTDNRRSNQFRSAIAVSLIGRLGGKDELPLLLEILSDEEINRPMYHTLAANYLYHNDNDRNFVYFAMTTHACAAIYKIYQREGLDKKELHRIFTELFSGDKLLRRITREAEGAPAHEEVSSFTSYMLKITE